MKMARGVPPGGGGGTISHRLWSMPNGIDLHLALVPQQLVREREVRAARYHHGRRPAKHQARNRTVDRAPAVGVLGTPRGRAPRAEEARDVREGVGVMDVDDVGALPGGGDVARRDLLAAERREGERPGDGGALPRGGPALAAALRWPPPPPGAPAARHPPRGSGPRVPCRPSGASSTSRDGGCA